MVRPRTLSFCRKFDFALAMPRRTDRSTGASQLGEPLLEEVHNCLGRLLWLLFKYPMARIFNDRHLHIAGNQFHLLPQRRFRRSCLHQLRAQASLT